MYIPIENMSRGIDKPSNPLLMRTIGHCTIAGENLVDVIQSLWHMSRDMRFPTTSKGSDQPAHARSLIRAFASRLNIL